MFLFFRFFSYFPFFAPLSNTIDFDPIPQGQPWMWQVHGRLPLFSNVREAFHVLCIRLLSCFQQSLLCTPHFLFPPLVPVPFDKVSDMQLCPEVQRSAVCATVRIPAGPLEWSKITATPAPAPCTHSKFSHALWLFLALPGWPMNQCCHQFMASPSHSMCPLRPRGYKNQYFPHRAWIRSRR